MRDILQSANSSFDIGDGPMFPDRYILQTGKVPAAAYTSPERFEAERDLFRRVWLQVGRAAEISNPGDWMVREIQIASASVIIARGKDGKINAFHNACIHRGTKVAWQSRGCSSALSCPYHAWSYHLDGRLRHVPDQQSFPDLDVEHSRLPPVAVDEWAGFLFINLDPEPRQSLREYLGGMGDLLADAPFGDFKYMCRMTGIVDSNWKLGLEAASEGYHVQVLHSLSGKDMVCSKENPHVHFVDGEFFGVHRRFSTTRNPEFALSASRPIHKMVFESIPQLVIDDHSGRKLAFKRPGINPTDHPQWSNDLFAIFPNFQLSLALNGFWTMQYWPIAVDRFFWQADYFYHEPPRSRREEFALFASAVANRDISSEDRACTEKQQMVLQSGVLSHLQFGEEEALCRHEAAVLESLFNGRGDGKILNWPAQGASGQRRS